jgi:hypothetical protein
MAEKTKAEQMRDLIEEMRTALKAAAGGVDERVQEVLAKMDALMAPAQ